MAKVVVRRLSRVATAEDGGLLLLGPMPPDHQHCSLRYSLSMQYHTTAYIRMVSAFSRLTRLCGGDRDKLVLLLQGSPEE